MASAPTLNSGDVGGTFGITPPASPRFPPGYGGTTRRDRSERTEERRAARDQSRAARASESAEDIEGRIQDWVSRLITAERNARDTAQQFSALKLMVEAQLDGYAKRFDTLESEIATNLSRLDSGLSKLEDGINSGESKLITRFADFDAKHDVAKARLDLIEDVVQRMANNTAPTQPGTSQEPPNVTRTLRTE